MGLPIFLGSLYENGIKDLRGIRMEFDDRRVCTALNADKLKVGSKVFLTDNIGFLKKLVKDDAITTNLVRILGEETNSRFEGSSDIFSLAYLIAPPEEPEYKPFSDTETAFKTITAHSGWLKGGGKTGKAYFFVTGFDIGCGDEDEIKIESVWLSAEYVFKHFVFADDGSPVGVKIEDTAPEEHHADK